MLSLTAIYVSGILLAYAFIDYEDRRDAEVNLLLFELHYLFRQIVYFVVLQLQYCHTFLNSYHKFAFLPCHVPMPIYHLTRATPNRMHSH